LLTVSAGSDAMIISYPPFSIASIKICVFVEFIKDAEKKTLQDIIRGRIVFKVVYIRIPESHIRV
jgi:hypothetical protein